ncbi:ninja-family protein Os03g0419100-like isoform X2 [Tripterygium wilfordii]|uniref:ninja-family protein Os03g0419100-like isoform X2 n=1 Tax=Tripterygium wilfordii TaxID=458696 RepID=UPI0018F83136|nr:ninja-family protein Os03g0419100-like isoform X2 [Tripterygium wilfordii]
MGEVNQDIKPVTSETADEYSKNLLNSFSVKPEKTQLSMNQESLKHSNLNLGLSLGGIYDEDLEEKPLARSSSVAGLIKKESVELSVVPSLERSRSMPVMGEQQDHGKAINVVEGMEIDAKNGLEKQRSPSNNVGKKRALKQTVEVVMPSSPSKTAAWAVTSAVKNPALHRALAIIKAGEACMAQKRLTPGSQKRELLQTVSAIEAFVHWLEARRAAENTRKSPEIPAVKGIGSSKTSSAAKEGSNSQELPKQEDVKPKVTSDDGKFVKPADRKPENGSERARLSNGIAEDEAMEMMRKMPTVTTTGDGPNGRRIEGFLYNYLKGEVTIVCICHGRFLSPEEFIRHAGGVDVSNPTRRIKICPSNF